MGHVCFSSPPKLCKKDGHGGVCLSPPHHERGRIRRRFVSSRPASNYTVSSLPQKNVCGKKATHWQTLCLGLTVLRLGSPMPPSHSHLLVWWFKSESLTPLLGFVLPLDSPIAWRHTLKGLCRCACSFSRSQFHYLCSH